MHPSRRKLPCQMPYCTQKQNHVFLAVALSLVHCGSKCGMHSVTTCLYTGHAHDLRQGIHIPPFASRVCCGVMAPLMFFTRTVASGAAPPGCRCGSCCSSPTGGGCRSSGASCGGCCGGGPGGCGGGGCAAVASARQAAAAPSEAPLACCDAEQVRNVASVSAASRSSAGCCHLPRMQARGCQVAQPRTHVIPVTVAEAGAAVLSMRDVIHLQYEMPPERWVLMRRTKAAERQRLAAGGRAAESPPWRPCCIAVCGAAQLPCVPARQRRQHRPPLLRRQPRLRCCNMCAAIGCGGSTSAHLGAQARDARRPMAAGHVYWRYLRASTLEYSCSSAVWYEPDVSTNTLKRRRRRFRASKKQSGTLKQQDSVSM